MLSAQILHSFKKDTSRIISQGGGKKTDKRKKQLFQLNFIKTPNGQQLIMNTENNSLLLKNMHNE